MIRLIFFLLKIIIDILVGFINILTGTIQQLITLIVLLTILWLDASLSKHTGAIDVIILFLPFAFMYSQGGRVNGI
jgi:hypothetical protein